MNEKLLGKVAQANFEDILKSKGYSYFERGSYNLNIIGVRAGRKNNENKNTFDDFLVVEYKDDEGDWKRYIHPLTTVPGLHYMNNPSAKKGVAILKPGQYRSIWKLDLHNGKYRALCQRGNGCIVYRDGNKDNLLDLDEATTEYGYFGINYHKAGVNSQVVGANSAGCQVSQKVSDFDYVMKLAEKASKIYGNSFTYTLIEEKDLKPCHIVE